MFLVCCVKGGWNLKLAFLKVIFHAAENSYGQRTICTSYEGFRGELIS